VFKGTSPNVQNDLIKASAAVLTDEIKRQIQEASFLQLSLMKHQTLHQNHSFQR